MRPFLSLVILLATAPLATAQDSTPLSTGRLSEHWKVLQGEWQPGDNEISGKARPGTVATLVSKKSYADFELELEHKMQGNGITTIHFRTHSMPAQAARDGSPTPANQLYGLTVSIDPNLQKSSPAKIDRTGDQIRVRLPQVSAEWNRLTVRAVDDRIRIDTGVGPPVIISSERFIAGAIALEINAAAADDSEVQFRNIEIKDEGRSGKWRPLFNGKDLDGWVEWGEEKWEVKDGVIYGSSGPKKSEGYLATKRTWKDFRVRGKFKMFGAGNFGLFYHSTIRLRPRDNYPLISGLQGEVEPSYPGSTGWVYESYKRGWLVQPDHASMEAHALRPDEWNEIEIRSLANHLTTWVNGIRVLDLVDKGQLLTEGFFALQLHTGGVEGIAWKDLYVEE